MSADTTKVQADSYVPTLDGWRAVAIMGVMLAHGSDAIFAPTGLAPSLRLSAYFSHGSIGVDIFFVLSGYLITYRLVNEYSTAHKISLKSFYIRRFFRICPPLIVFLAVVGIGAMCGLWQWPLGDLLTCMTFTRNYLAPATSGLFITSHLWSLAVEEHFYMIWPVLLVLLRPKWALPVSIGIALVVAGWAIVEFHQNYLGPLLPGVSYSFRTDIRIGSLFLGSAGALLGTRVRVLGWGGTFGWCVGVGVLAVTIVKAQLFGKLLQDMVILWLILTTTRNTSTIIGCIFEARPVKWIGRISYSLYIWQQLFLVPSYYHGPGWLQLPLVNIVASVVCAIGSYHFVEQPMIRYGRFLTRSRTSPPVLYRSGYRKRQW